MFKIRFLICSGAFSPRRLKKGPIHTCIRGVLDTPQFFHSPPSFARWVDENFWGCSRTPLIHVCRFDVIFFKEIFCNTWAQRDFVIKDFSLPRRKKIPGKGHFIDLSNEYKFIYVPRWISSEKIDY